MQFNFIVLVTVCSLVLTQGEANYRCSRRSVLKLIKRPAYQFSVDILKRITYNEGAHFVYAPMSTWMQIAALGEGATKSTFKEIWTATRQPRNACFKKQTKSVLSVLNRELQNNRKRRGAIIINKLLGVKKSFINNVEYIYGLKVVQMNFDNMDWAAEKVNNITSKGTGGAISEILYYNDFIARDMLFSDANYFKSEWRVPFNSAYTKVQPFYSAIGDPYKIGEVSMMNQIGLFNIIDFPVIDAKVLELPCSSRRLSMLVLLPRDKYWLGEIFYKLDKVRLTSIFDMYRDNGPRLVNVSLPRIKQRTETENLGELIYDMGIRRIFDPDKAELNNISKFKISASFMTQITKIEINERGVTAGVDVPNNLVSDDYTIDFVANRPFVYAIVDKQTEFILYAGAYSIPSVVEEEL